jgi:hypothetical protein
MLDALLSFTKAVCKSCLRIRDRYTPASGRNGSGPGNPNKAMNCQEILDFKEMCKYYSKIAEMQLFISEWKRYEIVPMLAAIVTYCHSSGRFASLGNMFFLSSNNSTTSTLYFLQIIAIVPALWWRWRKAFINTTVSWRMRDNDDLVYPIVMN